MFIKISTITAILWILLDIIEIGYGGVAVHNNDDALDVMFRQRTRSDWEKVWHHESHSKCRDKLIRHLYWACEKDIYRLSRRSNTPAINSINNVERNNPSPRLFTTMDTIITNNHQIIIAEDQDLLTSSSSSSSSSSNEIIELDDSNSNDIHNNNNIQYDYLTIKKRPSSERESRHHHQWFGNNNVLQPKQKQNIMLRTRRNRRRASDGSITAECCTRIGCTWEEYAEYCPSNKRHF